MVKGAVQATATPSAFAVMRTHCAALDVNGEREREREGESRRAMLDWSKGTNNNKVVPWPLADLWKAKGATSLSFFSLSAAYSNLLVADEYYYVR